MGRYFNPVHELPTVGRMLPTFSSEYSVVNKMLIQGEVLVGLYDNGIFKTAPFLTKKEDFDDFYQQYYQGFYLSVEYYAVPEEKVRTMLPGKEEV